MTTQVMKAYCSFSDTCDVSVWHAPEVGFSILSALSRSPSTSVFPEHNEVDGPMKAAFVLMSLQHKGLRVPEAVIKQLIVEARSK
jgi:hypothetical protein